MSTAIYIIAHAPLASALKSCAVHVYACDSRTQERIRAYDVQADADNTAIRDTVSADMGAHTDDGALILTDIVGATPSNIAHSLLDHADTSVVTGVNLPMVLTALCHRDEDLRTVTELVKKAGLSSIVDDTAH